MTWMSLRLNDRLNRAVHVMTFNTHTNIVPRMHLTLVQLKSTLQDKALMKDLHLNPRWQGDVADLMFLLAPTSFRFVIC
jgi:hypothetical protein